MQLCCDFLKILVIVINCNALAYSISVQLIHLLNRFQIPIDKPFGSSVTRKTNLNFAYLDRCCLF